MLNAIKGYLEKRRLPVLKCPECGKVKVALKEEGKILVNNHTRIEPGSDRVLQRCPGIRSEKGIEVKDKAIIKRAMRGESIFLEPHSAS